MFIVFFIFFLNFEAQGIIILMDIVVWNWLSCSLLSKDYTTILKRGFAADIYGYFKISPVRNSLSIFMLTVKALISGAKTVNYLSLIDGGQNMPGTRKIRCPYGEVSIYA